LVQQSGAGQGGKAMVVATLQATAGALLSVRQVAALLGVATATVYKLCASGEMPSVRVGAALRVSREALAWWVHSSERS